MARYDLYAHPEESGWLLDVQSDLLSDFNTRVVVPIKRPGDAPMPAGRLNPVFEIGGEKAIMVTQFMSAIPVSELKIPVTNLSYHQHEITGALDMLFLGF